MKSKNKVFIATSIDGFIADKNGGIEYLETIPELKQVDTGYHKFIDSIDALLMGRKTFEKVCSFDIDWPYQKPVFVLSTQLKQVPDKLSTKVFLVQGSLNDVLLQIRDKGYHQLYIDGGSLIQSFLREDLIDEMIITIIPILLGEGVPLFSSLPDLLEFECIKSEHFLDRLIQCHYRRKR